jgi:sugar/nucleoside kinase (ribokinase family)
MVRAPLEVVHVGSATRDIADDDPRGWRLGGGVTYAALTTARLGLSTGAIVGVDPEAAEAAELTLLAEAGVDVIRLPLAEGPVFHNLETPSGRVQTCDAVGRPMPVTPVPASWRAAAAWTFTPVAGELGPGWAAVASADAIVAVGWQGMLRTLRPGQRVERRPPRPEALLRRADLVGVSHHDVEPDTTIGDLSAFLQPATRLLVTQGAGGGILLEVGHPERAALRYLPTLTSGEVDATGAGDTFLAALLAATVRPTLLGPTRRRRGADLRFAAAAGSLTVEDVGLGGVPDLLAVRARAVRERVRRLVVPAASAQVSIEPAPV